MHIKNKNQGSSCFDNSLRFGVKFQSVIFGVLFFFITSVVSAQCAMCRAALAGESNIKKAEAVNNGIVYLMVVPYLLVAIIGVLIYRMYQAKKKKVE